MADDHLDDIFGPSGELANPDQLGDNEASAEVKAPAKAAKSSKKAPATGRQSGAKSGAKSGASKVPERVPMHIRQPIRSAGRTGYRRRVVKNDPMRIERLKMAGYTVVEDGTQIGDAVDGQAAQAGSVSAKVINSSNGGWGVLMEIPEKFYQEDLKAKHEKIDEDEERSIAAEAEKVGGGVGEFTGKISL